MKKSIQKSKIFALHTENTSYLFRVSRFGHLEHIYYGPKVNEEDAEALSYKSKIMYGNTVTYDETDDNYALNILPQEIGTSGRGDYREPSVLIEHGQSETLDFHYVGYLSKKKDVLLNGLPDAYGADKTLIIILKDEVADIEAQLIYSVFYKTDVITRKMILINHSSETVNIRKAMSFSMDLCEKDLVLMSFHGGWASEFHKSEKVIEKGKEVIESRCGFSSNLTNPGYILRKKNTDEEKGEAWGFNLIYSGNHYSSISRNDKDMVRVMSGIQPEGFSWPLSKDEKFETPCAVLTYSENGLNELSQNFHHFINEHIVRGPYKKKDRPILLNSWEGFFFDFNETQLMDLAVEAKALGIELFVLDDGWFKGRDNDHAGLGDYEVNHKKLPRGLFGLSEEIHKLGLKFGLWFEPEAVSPDSDCYRNHPDWAIENEYPNVYGRHELLLNLTKKEVRDYIVNSVSEILDKNRIDYVKWDMNRQMAGVSGEFSHRYILGLYEVLERIFKGRKILFESCSAGGNRFDLGMMCYSPQIWTSDNTDAIERLRIQKNVSYLYPLSVMGAHVNKEVGDQTLRRIPLTMRFNVAAFGLLGYELDVRKCSDEEKEEIRKQVEYYRNHRNVFVYGDFYRISDDEGKESFEVTDSQETIVGKFRKQLASAPSYDILKVYGLNEGEIYSVTESRKRKEKYIVSGKALEKGIILNNLYLSTGVNEDVRTPLDSGSELYEILKEEG